jgi:hypothetical protein
MDREGIIKSCYDIFTQFEENEGLKKENVMLDFFVWISKRETDFIDDILKDSELKFEDDPAVDVFFDLWQILVMSAFGLGFAVGSLQKSITPDIKKAIDDIRTVIAKEAFPNHVPEARA